jgi:glycosyltransferase involved in cell wall biosynthesis
MTNVVGKQTIVFLATTPFAVNAFLRAHIAALSPVYRIMLCVNTHAYPLSEDVRTNAEVLHVDFARKIAPWQDLKALTQLLMIFARISPHAVHSITPKAGLLGMSAAWLMRIPLRCHTFTGQVWATRRGIDRWLLKQFDKLIALFSTQVFADSQSQCRLLESENIAQKGHISVLGPGSIAGVDVGRFHPDADVRQTERAAADTLASSTVFLYVGRLARDKGVFDLLAAFSKVAAMNGRVELWMVGPDEEGLLAQLVDMAAGRNCGRVRWCGATAQPERYMAAADIFVLPSYREGFGSVIIEAAACGVPSIAYRIDGVVDAVIEDQTGVLVSLRDIEALAAAMQDLAVNNEKRCALGERARMRVEKEYSSATVTTAWLAFYERELHRDGGCESIG